MEYILIADYKRDNTYLHEALADLDIQIQKEELQLRFILHNLEEELRENQEIIQELKQDIIAMEQVIDAVDYRTCGGILEYYDCTSSLDEINSIKNVIPHFLEKRLEYYANNARIELEPRTIYGHLRDY